jgi:hypothetical protein
MNDNFDRCSHLTAPTGRGGMLRSSSVPTADSGGSTGWE